MTEQLIRAESAPVSPYDPTTPDQAMSMATKLAASGLLGKIPPRPETVLYLMARGHELGFSTVQSISAFHIIEGVPTLKADAKVALCLKRPDVCEYLRCTVTNDMQATWETKRHGSEPQSHTYTIEDAETAGLLKESSTGRPTPWQTRPKTMLRWRCATELIAMVYADLMLGLYTPEEQAEIAEAEGRIIDVTPAGEPVSESIEEINKRALRAQVTNDLRAIKAGDGDAVKERIDQEATARAEAAEGTLIPGGSAEAAMNPPRPKEDAPAASNATPVPTTPAAAPGSGEGDADQQMREDVAYQVEHMTPGEAKVFFASLTPPLSIQTPTLIRNRIGMSVIKKMYAALVDSLAATK